MMTYFVLAVRDRAANVFGQPHFSVSVESGVRAFKNEINRSDPNNQLFTNSEDFDLYVLGTYDDDSGTFNTGTPKQCAVGKDLKS